MVKVDSFRRVQDYLKQIGQDGKATPGGKAAYGQWPREAEPLMELELQWLELVKLAFNEDQALDVLDAGCGNGIRFIPFIESLLRSGKSVKVRSRDIQPEAIDEVVKNYVALQNQADIDARQGDLTELNLLDNSLNGIMVSSVLGWLPSQEALDKTIGQFYRVTKPRGLVFASVMSPYNRVGIYNSPEIEEGNVSRRDEMWNLAHFDGQEVTNPITVANARYNKNIILFTRIALERTFIDQGFKIETSEYFRNKQYPNRFNDQYPENINLIARK